MHKKNSNNLFIKAYIYIFHLANMNLLILKFRLTTNTYRSHAYSKSRWSKCFFTHIRVYTFVAHFVMLESLGWGGVQRGGSIIFPPMMEKLLNIEQLSHWSLFKSELKNIGEFGYIFGIVGNPLAGVIQWRWFGNFWRYWILSNFCHWKFN